MKRHGRQADANLFGDLPGGDAGWPCADKQPENAKPVLMSEGSEGGDDLGFIHNSTIQEMLYYASGIVEQTVKSKDEVAGDSPSRTCRRAHRPVFRLEHVDAA